MKAYSLNSNLFLYLYKIIYNTMEDKDRNVKKINEFKLNWDDLEFGEGPEMTPEEIEEDRRKINQDGRDTAKMLGIKPKKPDLGGIDGYRGLIEIRKSVGNETRTDEEIDEYCMKRFGEPYRKNN